MMWRYAVAGIAVAGALWLSYNHGRSVEQAMWTAKWEREAKRLTDEKNEALLQVHELELKAQQKIEEVQQHAEQQLARNESDRNAADAAFASLHKRAEQLASRAGNCPSHATVAPGSKAGSSASVVLADVLRRADERAGELAAAYDRSRTAGLACEEAYAALTGRSRVEAQGELK